MSEQRWAVLSTEAMNGWLVVHPGDVLRTDYGRLECWDVHSRHHTWEEAMQEADRMARTITVTLPRVAPEEWTTVGDFHVIPEPTWQGDDLMVSRIRGEGAHIIIGKEDCEPLALVLLAHARKETN